MSTQQELDAFKSKPIELKDLQTVIELQNKRIKELEQRIYANCGSECVKLGLAAFSLLVIGYFIGYATSDY